MKRSLVTSTFEVVPLSLAAAWATVVALLLPPSASAQREPAGDPPPEASAAWLEQVARLASDLGEAQLGRPPEAVAKPVAVGQLAPGDFVRHYFKEAQPLELDRGRIGVYAPRGLNSAALPPALARSGLEAMVVAGWYLVPWAHPLESNDELGQRLQALVGSGAFEFVTPVFADELGGPLLVTPEILVQFEEGVEAATAEEILASVGAGSILERDWAGMKNAYRVASRHGDGREVLADANALARLDEVRFAEPDFLFSGRGAQDPPDDPSFGWSWALYSPGVSDYDADYDLGALAAWEITRGDPSIRVLIIDVGVDPLHPDLNQDPGADFTGQGGGGAPVNACDNHGTTVAGCVSAIADNGLGTAGIAPECKVVSARTFISNLPCDGGWSAMNSWTVDALAWAASQGIRVTNNSNRYGVASSAVSAMYQQTKDQNGMIHFASSGNEGASTVTFPARAAAVNAVGAANFNGRRVSWSNYGVDLDFMAPGVDILTTDRSGADGWWSGDYMWSGGTSLASPYAAGVVALMLSERPGLTPLQIEGLLRLTTRDMETPSWDAHTGWGMVNAAKALQPRKAVKVEPLPADHGVRTCDWPTASDDARFVAFASYSSELVAGDSNSKPDIFVRDQQSGTIVRASVGPAGAQANDGSRQPAISADGRYVAFESWASNLVAGDTNGRCDVFLRDTLTLTTMRVSVSSAGVQANRESSYASISADGRYVAFHSAGKLDTPVTGGVEQVYVRDVLAGTTTMVSKDSLGAAGNSISRAPSISADGQRIAFETYATNLLLSDANGSIVDVLVYDVPSSSFLLATLDHAGQQVAKRCGHPAISRDGTAVAFTTHAGLVPGDSNGVTDVYVRDLVAGTTVGGSTDGAGVFAGAASISGRLSGDGRYLVFESGSPGLVVGDTNGYVDLFRKDLQTGAVIRVSLGSAGQEALEGSGKPWIAPDGVLVAFTCRDDALTAGDAADGHADVYLRSISAGTTVLVTW